MSVTFRSKQITILVAAAVSVGCGPPPGDRYSTDPDRHLDWKHRETAFKKKHPLGSSDPAEYAKQVLTAVERQWQSDCERHRDFIIPGKLVVSFRVNPDGNAENIRLNAGRDLGEIQKGFTYNSIRYADIPRMPESLKAKYATNPLELTLNLHF